jgi:hypothetical protein
MIPYAPDTGRDDGHSIKGWARQAAATAPAEAARRAAAIAAALVSAPARVRTGSDQRNALIQGSKKVK